MLFLFSLKDYIYSVSNSVLHMTRNGRSLTWTWPFTIVTPSYITAPDPVSKPDVEEKSEFEEEELVNFHVLRSQVSKLPIKPIIGCSILYVLDVDPKMGARGDLREHVVGHYTDR